MTNLTSCDKKQEAEEPNPNNLFTSLLGKSGQEVQARMDSLWNHFFTPGDLSKYEAVPVNASLSEHTITICPNDPAIVFEKVVIDAGGYKRSYLFMDESEYVKE